eukprot:382608-Rhodomonas_salina.1
MQPMPGLCEQELFWLLASKRHVLNAWLCSAPQADAQKALSTTLQLVVENDGVAWALLGNGVGELQDGVLVSTAPRLACIHTLRNPTHATKHTLVSTRCATKHTQPTRPVLFVPATWMLLLECAFGSELARAATSG